MGKGEDGNELSEPFSESGYNELKVAKKSRNV